MIVTVGKVTVETEDLSKVNLVEKNDAFLLKNNLGKFIKSVNTGKPVRFKTQEQAEKFAKRLREFKLVGKQVKEPLVESPGYYQMTAQEWLDHVKSHPAGSVGTMMVDGVKQTVVFDFCSLPHTQSELEARLTGGKDRFAEFYLPILTGKNLS